MEEITDLRAGQRSCTVFKPARIDLDGKPFLGMMTDVSAGGAGLLCPGAPSPGSVVYLATGDDPLRRATVVWRSEENFGVSFDDCSSAVIAADKPYRSVRVPTDIPARLYVHGIASEARITNISPRGLAFESDATLEVGQIVSLEAGGQALENVTIRWAENNRFGARLPIGVKLSILQELVHANAREAADCRRHARIG